MRAPGIVVAVLAAGAIGMAAQGAPAFAAAGEPPPAVSTGQAEGVEQSTATLTGTVDTQGYQTKYEFDLGADTGYGIRVFGNAGFEPGTQTFRVPLRDLMPGTTYHYRILATNVFGTSYGLDQTFTTSVYPSATLTPPATAPLVPAPVLAPEPTAGGPKAASVGGAKAAQTGHTHVAGRAGVARRGGSGSGARKRTAGRRRSGTDRGRGSR
jgi:hypothetical protein